MAEAETTEIESITSESEEEGPSSPAKKLKSSQKTHIAAAKYRCTGCPKKNLWCLISCKVKTIKAVTHK
jgi:hypothetical protein